MYYATTIENAKKFIKEVFPETPDEVLDDYLVKSYVWYLVAENKDEKSITKKLFNCDLIAGPESPELYHERLPEEPQEVKTPAEIVAEMPREAGQMLYFVSILGSYYTPEQIKADFNRNPLYTEHRMHCLKNELPETLMEDADVYRIFCENFPK